ncbi:MAG: putative metalloprotease CJM1_0395 family protein [Pseudomonadota bacterium]
MIVNSFPPSNANTVTPYVPLGRQPVGQENSDLKTSSLKALEQSAAVTRNENRRIPDDQIGRQAQQQSSQTETQAARKEQLAKDQITINALSARDREVRAHEQAHAAVGGQYAGAPTYEFVRGPDGVSYAVGGEVSINAGSVPNDPEETIRKAQQIRAAANAPADPSGQDRSVAAAATRLESEARIELSNQKNAELQAKETLAAKQINAQKAEEAKKTRQEQYYSNEQKQALSRQQESAADKDAQRLDTFEKANNKTINLNRHLVDIGVVNGSSAIGNFLNNRV